MPPRWLTVVAWISLAGAVVTAAAIGFDIYGRGLRQKLAVMEAVWPVTALYFGPFAWPAYRRWGRSNSPEYQRRGGAKPQYGERVSVAIGVGLQRDGVVAALKADALSLTAFEVGLFGWMAVMQLVLFTQPHLTPAHAAYWFLMQIGMVLGFITAYPVNVWLLRRGIKEAM